METWTEYRIEARWSPTAQWVPVTQYTRDSVTLNHDALALARMVGEFEYRLVKRDVKATDPTPI